MISIRDKVKKQLEQASVETAAVEVPVVPPNAKDRGYYIDLKNVKASSRMMIGQYVAKLEGWESGDDEFMDIVDQADKDKFVYGEKVTLNRIKKYIVNLVPGVIFTDGKEIASIEVAAASTKKMAAKIAAIAQNMKLTEKQWNSVDKAVRAALFG